LLGFPLFLSGGELQTTFTIAPQRIRHGQFKESLEVAYDSKGNDYGYDGSDSYGSKGKGDAIRWSNSYGSKGVGDDYGGSDRYDIKSLRSSYA
jgi:hypothetical protein